MYRMTLIFNFKPDYSFIYAQLTLVVSVALPQGGLVQAHNSCTARDSTSDGASELNLMKNTSFYKFGCFETNTKIQTSREHTKRQQKKTYIHTNLVYIHKIIVSIHK